ncbi:MAG: bifunctional 5,10-methylenetetrahydrofolate dehydrogenase/5,10-methenyltetrahydrofolate cyclohydrolase [Chlamydiia bacterium]|nr:bifunctional 5,10-methylenetetrahydrofolate dehydrogenase/5,10-methenyltetrahydrofolate cyclohydrolase [Chlamydiia bacterium]
MIIDGKKIADSLLKELKREIANMNGRPPCLKIILVGENPASEVYVTRKLAAAEAIGIDAKALRFDAHTSEHELFTVIDQLNEDSLVDGIIVQMPLPAKINPDAILARVSPQKDVDGFTPTNLGKLLAGLEDGFVSATPLGVQTLLLKSGVDIAGKQVVIVGRSRIVGRPLFALLSRKGKGGDATVTLAHSGTKDLISVTKTADILIVAAGSPEMITKEHIKPGAVVIDVGINRHGKRLVGDVKFNEVEKVASLITPVPGGVGPMTIASLLKNTTQARKMYG